MFVAIEGGWFAIVGEISLGCLAVGEKALTFYKQQLHQLPRGIIDKNQQCALWSSPFEPIIGRAVDLHQFPKTGPSLPHLVGNHFPGLLCFPQFFFDHDPAQTTQTDLHPFLLHQLFVCRVGPNPR